MASPKYRHVSTSSLADEQEIQDHTASPTQHNDNQSASLDTKHGFRQTGYGGPFAIPRKPVAVAAVESVQSSKAEEHGQVRRVDVEQPRPDFDSLFPNRMRLDFLTSRTGGCWRSREHC